MNFGTRAGLTAFATHVPTEVPLKGPETTLALFTRPVLPENATATVAVPDLPFPQDLTAPLTPLSALFTSERPGVNGKPLVFLDGELLLFDGDGLLPTTSSISASRLVDLLEDGLLEDLVLDEAVFFGAVRLEVRFFLVAVDLFFLVLLTVGAATVGAGSAAGSSGSGSTGVGGGSSAAIGLAASVAAAGSAGAGAAVGVPTTTFSSGRVMITINMTINIAMRPSVATMPNLSQRSFL